MTASSMPQFNDLMWPALKAIESLGGSATVQEMNEAVVDKEGYPEEIQAVPHADSGRTELEYRLAWARTYLGGLGALENSSRGVWAITEKGRRFTQEQLVVATKAYRALLVRRRNQRTSDEMSGDIDPETNSWKDQLLTVLQRMKPDAFERLAQRLLREAGFLNVKVVGQSGDGGIDVVGVYRLSLVSFPVFCQCKRYKGSVPPRAVRDFRGAMEGRGDKGLVITTGKFTKEAVNEATRDGARPIELVDGDRLCDLLKEYRLGVVVAERIVQDVLVSNAFFDEV